MSKRGGVADPAEVRPNNTMRISSIAPFAASAALALAARADVARSNECFAVAWNSANGALASLVVNGDADRMNWISGLESWGEIRTNVKKIGGRDGWTGAAFRDSEKLPFRGMREEGDWVVSVYDNGILRAEVFRELTRDALKERYVFTNVSKAPLYFGRGDLGILATFNDDYAGADECIRRRCSAHVWCGGGNSWVRAVKMGPFPTELALPPLLRGNKPICALYIKGPSELS